MASASHKPELNEMIARYSASKTGVDVEVYRPFSTLGVFDNGQLLAGLVFHDLHKEYGTIEISGAGESKRWLTRKAISLIGEISFSLNGCQTLIARVASDNRKSAQLFECSEFEKSTLPNLRGAGVDELVFTITAKAWRCHRMNKGMK